MIVAANREPEISVVLPAHNESGNIGPLFDELRTVLAATSRAFEIVYVNDGSTDSTLAELAALLPAHPFLRVIDLDGNFGEAAALSAGFAATRGRIVATLDADGQNDPRDLPRLLEAMDRHGYRAVSGRRVDRRENLVFRVLPSRLANRMIAGVTGIPLHDSGCGLKAYRRDVLRHVALPPGMHRFLPAILGVAAGEVGEVGVGDRGRRVGGSHYGLGRTIVVLRDLVSLPFVLRPRARATRLGIGLLFVAAVGAGLGRPWGPWLAGLCGAPLAAAWWNLRRFRLAREHGVYRIRRELAGGDDSASEGNGSNGR